jgi:hypothetical protein
MGQTVAELIHRGLTHARLPDDPERSGSSRIDADTGLPTIRSPRPVTAEDVRAIEDE